jgi:AraC-like DNA-binding protein
MISQICKIIEELLPHRNCNVERVAEYFSIHRFTLYRYLNQYQTNFESLLEATRKKIAVKLLKNKKLMIIEVANQVGYDDQANFTRAFKRWYGITPGRWRRINIHV